MGTPLAKIPEAYARGNAENTQETQMSRRSRKSKTRSKSRKWSAEVTRKSDALDIKKDTFSSDDPRAIARSLKQSADHSTRRKANPFRSALSMLTFYINRAGTKLSARRRSKLERAKEALRDLYHK
jgi:type IV secretory pathway VirB10-like protein